METTGVPNSHTIDIEAPTSDYLCMTYYLRHYRDRRLIEPQVQLEAETLHQAVAATARTRQSWPSEDWGAVFEGDEVAYRID